MGPRKKSRPENEDAATASSTNATDADGDVTMTDARPSTPKQIPAAKLLDSQTPESKSISDASRSSWYSTWTIKSRPVTEVAKESAVSASSSIANNSSTDVPVTPITRRSVAARNASLSDDTPSPKRHFSGSLKGPIKGTPLAATISNVSITSSKAETKVAPDSEGNNPVVKEPAPLPPDPVTNTTTPAKSTDPAADGAKPSAGWFGGWWSRPDGYTDAKAKEEAKEYQILEEAKNKLLPALTPSETPEQSKLLSNDGLNDPVNGTADVDAQSGPKTTAEDSKSWFWRWSKAQNVQTMSPPSDGKPTKPTEQISETILPPPEVPLVTDEQPTPKDPSIKDGRESIKRKPAGWAFWSKETKDGEENTPEGHVVKQVGELAVANTPSQSQPEAAQFNEIEEQKQKKDTKGRKGRGRPKSIKDEIALPSSSKTSPSSSPAPVKVKDAAKDAAKGVKVEPPKNNLLLPEFSKTYSLVHQSSIWQQLRDYFVGSEDQHPHLHIVPNPPRIKKALAIGIHGFFPGAFFQSLFGPPTGTSIRFANNAASAIKAWTEIHGYECDIEKVALEGEGLITDRVDTLWKLLLNWIDHVRSADLIMLACHSQGVPVSIMLVEKLVQFGCIGPGTRIGICAMAGVNMGPFSEYKTQIFGKSALELFDFSNQNSKVSKLYLAALETVLKAGVKIVYVGSIDDQLVSLDVSLCSTLKVAYNF
jgi:hypothetical protein